MQLSKHFTLKEMTKSMTATRKGINNIPGPGEIKNLGLSKKNCDSQNRIRTENLILKQQLELLKHCNKVNANPSYLYNENFKSLALKCKGIISVNEEVLNKKEEGNHWENLKKEYMEKNPGDYMGEDATKKLKIPKYLTDDKEIVLPIPTND